MIVEIIVEIIGAALALAAPAVGDCGGGEGRGGGGEGGGGEGGGDCGDDGGGGEGDGGDGGGATCVRIGCGCGVVRACEVMFLCVRACVRCACSCVRACVVRTLVRVRACACVCARVRVRALAEHLNVNKHSVQYTVASCTQIKRGRTRPLRSDYLTRHTGGRSSYSGRGVPAATAHIQQRQRMILSIIR